MIFEFAAAFLALPFLLACSYSIAALAAFIYLFSRSKSSMSFCLFVISVSFLTAMGYHAIQSPSPFDPLSYIRPIGAYLGIGVGYALFDVVWAVVTFRSKTLEIKSDIKAQFLESAKRTTTSRQLQEEYTAWDAFWNGTLDYSDEFKVNAAQNALHRYVSAFNKRDPDFFLIFEPRNVEDIKSASTEDLMVLEVSRSRLTQRILSSTLYFPIKAVKLLLGDILDRLVRGLITVFQAQLQKVVNVLFKDLLKF